MTHLKDKPFALIGIHVGGASAKQLKEVMAKDKITWRSFVDAGNAGAGPIATKWNLSATPTFYVIDHEGVIRYKWAGAPGRKVMDDALDKLIRAAEGHGGQIRRDRQAAGGGERLLGEVMSPAKPDFSDPASVVTGLSGGCG